jgi:ComF family protein
MAHFEGPLKEAIHKYKYEYVKALRDDLSDIAWPYLEDFPKNAILTCVPSSPKRLAWRGYNQAEEIAKILAQKTGMRYYPNLLRRTEYKIPQTQLRRKERFENVKNSFKAGKKMDLEGKQVVIFDDLVTSGATLDACARELRKMGATRVWGFVLARNK